MNPLTSVDPPEIIEVGFCPKCNSIHTDVEQVDTDEPECRVVCVACKFEGPVRRTPARAADAFNDIEEDDLLEDCEHCSGSYDVTIEHKSPLIGSGLLHRAVCGCGASGSWDRGKGDVIDRHNELMGLIRG